MGCEGESFLKSSPNILENFQYDDFCQMKSDLAKPLRMTSPQANIFGGRTTKCTAKSPPKFSETIERNPFMRNIINTKGYEKRYSSPSEKEATVRRSLEEISKDIREIEDFLTVTENIIQREKERDKELYAREKRRKSEQNTRARLSPNKENKSPSPKPFRLRPNSQKSPPVTYKINSYKNTIRRGAKPLSPRCRFKSKLYFRNGKIGCLDAEQTVSNIESTHALVKHILKYENEKPLVSPESVRRALECTSPPQQFTDGYSVCDSIHSSIANVTTEREELILQKFTEDPITIHDITDVHIRYNEPAEVPKDEKNIACIETMLESELVAVDDITPDTPHGTSAER